MRSSIAFEAPSQTWLTRRSTQRLFAGLVAGVAAVLLLAPSAAFASGSSRHTCAVLTSGKVNCWGYNFWGQIGNNTTVNATVPAEVSGITNAIQVSAGLKASCAVLSSGKVKCWGDNGNGQLGVSSATLSSAVPVEVSGITNAIQVSVASWTSCAVLSSGGVKCWGHNGQGSLGNGTNGLTLSDSFAPVSVSGITDAVQVSVGDYHVCAVLSSGKINCWGSGGYAQLGNGSNADSSVPVEVSGITNAVRVGSGFATCAVLSSGKVNCWGGIANYSNVPVEVSGITNAVDLSYGWSHLCAVLSSGKVNCWGNNDWRKLGLDTDDRYRATPFEVPGISTAVRASVNYDTSCVLLSSGKANCWGSNGSPATNDYYYGFIPETVIGGLGNSSVGGRDSGVPVEVSNVSNFAHLGEFGAAAPADTTPPAAPILSGAPSGSVTSSSATISFTAEDGATFTCSLDGGAYAACSSPRSLSGLAAGPHTFSVKASDAAGNTSLAETASWTVTASVAPFLPPTVLTPAAGTKTVVKATVDGKGTWVMKLGLLFSTGGDTRGASQFLTVQVAVDSSGRPVSTKPSDSQPLPTTAAVTQGVVSWDASGETARQSINAPVWVRVGNRVGKWTGWVKLTQ